MVYAHILIWFIGKRSNNDDPPPVLDIPKKFMTDFMALKKGSRYPLLMRLADRQMGFTEVLQSARDLLYMGYTCAWLAAICKSDSFQKVLCFVIDNIWLTSLSLSCGASFLIS